MIKRMNILKLVWKNYHVPVAKRRPECSLVGWSEIANFLGVVPRHAKDLLYSSVVASPHVQEQLCSFTYVAVPPDRMSVFLGPREDKERNWDKLGAAEPLICTPTYREAWSEFGGPYFLRVVDIAKKFPKDSHTLLDIIDGDMLAIGRTKANLIPVCWNKASLARWNNFRERTVLIKRSAAGRALSLESYLAIKSPDSDEVGALKYVCGRTTNSPNAGDTP